MTDKTFPSQSRRAPNILFIMADQLAAPTLPIHGHPVVQTPHLQALAIRATVFDAAYCASPLCGPSRFSLLAGRLPSAIGAYDKAAEFPAGIPTLFHYLRAGGYRTSMAGKQHFVGPDQLHGAEERLTSDIYPADFGWTPNWDDPRERLSWHHNLLSVIEAGPCVRDLQMDFDEETVHQARRRLYDFARQDDARPFCLMVSLTHPHDPYNIPREYWDRYDHHRIDLPRVAALPYEAQDPHSRRLYDNYGLKDQPLSDEQIRNARHAYYGAVSYVDEQVGVLLDTLRRTGLDRDTIVVFTGDHGDMLGERGLWYKMSFFEWSARVPLMIFDPRRPQPQRVSDPVSHLDLLPTLLEMTGLPTPLSDADGHSLLPLLSGKLRPQPVVAEYLAEGAVAPILMVRQGPYKYIHCDNDPPQFYNLQDDPLELDNLAGRPDVTDQERILLAALEARWDAATRQALTEQVKRSQRRRRLVSQALLQGRHTPWDFEPYGREAERYIRNISATLGDTERLARLPRQASPAPAQDPVTI